MFKARVVSSRYYWLVGIFLVYGKSVESQQMNVRGLRDTPLEEVYGSREFMRYCDHEWPIFDQDEICDRIVSINKRNFTREEFTEASQIMAPGVYIDKNHVLTSYTPFRRLAAKQGTRDLSGIYITHLIAKRVSVEHELQGYLLKTVNVMCGRQIFPNSKTDVYLRKGEKFLHVPNYDLMVLKTEVMIDFLHPKMRHVVQRPKRYFVMGPQLTELVSEDGHIGDHLKYVSLGMIDYDHVYERNHLHTVELTTDDRLLADCDEWFDEATSFICIRNIENQIAIGSGALLFSGEKVIGVGCFTIQKGKESIHVFTDVRNVLHLINTTCTEFDGFPD